MPLKSNKTINLKWIFKSGKVYYLKGKALMELKQYKESIICFDKAICLKPKEAMFYNSKG